MKKDAIWEWNITIWVMTYLLPLRKNTKLVVATVGGGFQVGEPPAIMLFVTEEKEEEGEDAKKINEYSWNCGVICVTGVQRAFLLARETSSHDRDDMSVPGRFGIQCMSVKKHAPYHRNHHVTRQFGFS